MFNVFLRPPRCATTPFLVHWINFTHLKTFKTCVFLVRPKIFQIPTKPSFLHSKHHVGVRGPLFFFIRPNLTTLYTPPKIGSIRWLRNQHISWIRCLDTYQTHFCPRPKKKFSEGTMELVRSVRPCVRPSVRPKVFWIPTKPIFLNSS